jgi:hypothetical protein
MVIRIPVYSVQFWANYSLQFFSRWSGMVRIIGRKCETISSLSLEALVKRKESSTPQQWGCEPSNIIAVFLSYFTVAVNWQRQKSHWTDFHEIWYVGIFRKSVAKVQVSLKSDKNYGTLHENLCSFITICLWIYRRMKNVSHKNSNILRVWKNRSWIEGPWIWC